MMKLLCSLLFVAVTYVESLNTFKHISQYKSLEDKRNIDEIFSSASDIIYTENGYVEGTLTATNRVFRKIPYSKPPINSTGRWHNPRKPSDWGPDYVLEAKGDPPACPQAYCGQWEACGRKQTQVYSEDCLYLNVNTPINITNTSSLLPVMFWIHGGEWLNGYGGGFLYNGSDLANTTNVITVTINYRLGALGFYWNEKYDFEGNYAIQDQIMALEWVQSNIEYFGGDPNRVTIFGQSAGAMSIGVLGQLEETKNLYQNAIWESEPLGLPMRTKETWGQIPQLLVELSKCEHIDDKQKTLDCLYSLSADEVLALQSQIDTSPVQLEKFLDAFVPWTATIGTGLVPQQPFWYYSNYTGSSNSSSKNIGNSNGKPLLAGVVRNEADLFVFGAFPDGLGYDELIALYHVILKTQENVDKITQQYPIPTNTTDYRRYASNVVTDGLFHCPNRNITATLSSEDKGNQDNIFYYHFEHVPSFGYVIWDPINATYCLNRVCHGDDLPFVFRPNTGPINVTLTPSEWDLAYSMQYYWSEFAKNGKPANGRTNKYNNGTIVEWNNFNTSTQSTMALRADNIQMIDNYDLQKCKVWDQIGYPWLPRP